MLPCARPRVVLINGMLELCLQSLRTYKEQREKSPKKIIYFHYYLCSTKLMLWIYEKSYRFKDNCENWNYILLGCY